METVFFCSELFPSNENLDLNYWKPIFKEIPYFNNITDFLASAKHFLPFFQTAVKMEENGTKKRQKIVSARQKISFH